MGERLIGTDSVREIQNILEANLSHLCDIQYDATDGAPNAGGGIVPLWTSAVDGLVPCEATQVLPGTLQDRNAQQQSISTWRVRFRAGEIVTERNRLIVTGEIEGVAFERVFTVLGVSMTDRTTIAQCREATAAEAS